ncbi:FAD dependent oxidoreductase [Annulohypoxylon bovei var. microspora]|nr:FAD dependent oxidoreductase [Annulohypoxylon bovei var. microspora]
MFARTARRQLRSSTGLSHLVRSLSSTAPVEADFTHVVIGGGVVGLAIARALASHNPSGTDTTLLLERHPHLGTETSSRNSEVIHGGLYYGPDSLKTRLCIAGRKQLYDFCAAYGVPHRKTGKWVVAQDAAELEVLQKIHETCEGLGVPTRFVGREEAQRLEPSVRAEAGVLESPETGIVDSHALMGALRGLFEDAGGLVAANSDVIAIQPLHPPIGRAGRLGRDGYRLLVRDAVAGESAVTARAIVNSAGLGACRVHNMLAPPHRRVRPRYAKGNYFSYGAAAPRVGRLVYPAPVAGAGGLGTHLTLDLAGRVRFGPDVERVRFPHDLTVSAARLPAAVAAIRRYLPAVDEAALAPDYAGIRPKLQAAAGDGDFYIRQEDGFDGWVNLLGIESPGLTSCLAIGDLVRDMLYGNRKVEGSAAPL